jgi:hypothetical protein
LASCENILIGAAVLNAPGFGRANQATRFGELSTGGFAKNAKDSLPGQKLELEQYLQPDSPCSQYRRKGF